MYIFRKSSFPKHELGIGIATSILDWRLTRYGKERFIYIVCVCVCKWVRLTWTCIDVGQYVTYTYKYMELYVCTYMIERWLDIFYSGWNILTV